MQESHKSNFIHHLAKILIDVMFYGGILCCIAAPFAMPAITKFLGNEETAVIPFTIFTLISGICAIYIFWQLKSMFKTLLGGNPFNNKNVDCLKKCCAASFIISLVFMIKSIFWFTIAASVATVIFILLGLFCITLKDVFKQAIAYKEENDWTV